MSKKKELFKNFVSNEKAIQQIIEDKNQKKFNQYINRIIFPYYKNFSEFSEINFDFPLTVLVGRNGAGKSSILHALYGAPRQFTISHFWFSTAVDPIKDGDGINKRQSFMYNYTDSNRQIFEKYVIYKRASRPGTKTKKENPDYWETEKMGPSIFKKYKINKQERVPPIYEKSIYIDFRSQLSAYDKFFYFENQKDMKLKKNDYVRSWVSDHLKDILSDKTNNKKNKKEHSYEGIYYRKEHKKGQTKFIPQNNPMKYLTPEEIHYISYILGNNYSKIKIVYHRLYKGKWGYTIMMKRDGFQYSEAHAGSGEFSICMLVHELYKTIQDQDSDDNKNHNHNLIILDEPECSLYPGAQSRFLTFLLNYIVLTHNQVFISSHSTRFIKGLPESAVKRIYYDNNDHKTYIEDHCLPTEAFNELETDITKCNVYCEDNAAKILLNECINTEGNTSYNILKIIETNNGSEAIINNSIYPSAMLDTKNCFYFLDGDKLSDEINKFSSYSEEELNKILKDPKQVNDLTNSISTKLPLPSSKPRKSERKTCNIQYDELKDKARINAQKKFLKFFHEHVYYLPKTGNDFGTPESIIFNNDYVQSVIKSFNIDITNKRDTNQIKKWYDQICTMRYGKSDTDKRNSLLEEFTYHWARVNDSSFQSIQTNLKDIVKIYNKSLGD